MHLVSWKGLLDMDSPLPTRDLYCYLCIFTQVD